MNTQINLSFPEIWKTQLERLARIYSVEEENTLSFHDLIRRAIQEKYELNDGNEEEQVQEHSTL